MLKSLMGKASLIAVACSLSFSAFAAAQTPANVDVPAGELVSALKALATQSDVELVYQPEQLRDIHTDGVKGIYSPQEAIAILLQGTQLRVYTAESGAMIIVPTSSGQAIQDGEGVSGSLPGAKPSGDSVAAPPSSEQLKPAEQGSLRQRYRLAQSDSSNSPRTGARQGRDEKIAPGSAAASDNEPLGEIVVSARRRAEIAQRVPETVQVISQRTLAHQNVQTLRDLQYLVPGLSGNTNTPNAIRLSLRGQGASGNASWPGVILFLDEVPFPNFGGGASNFGPGLFFDLENIQVLKGPQGTLFGKSSVGGDVLLRSARPTDDFGGYVNVGFGNHNNRELDGAVNIPLVSDKLLARIAFWNQTRDGYTDILGTPSWPNGIDGDNRDARSVRVAVTFRPTDWLQNDTIWTDSQASSRSTYGQLTYLVPGGQFEALHPSVVALLAQLRALGARTSLPLDVDPVANVSTKMVTNTTVISLGENLQLKNIAGYDKENNTFAGDQDGTVFPYLNIYGTPYSVNIWQYSDELQLAGSSFGKKLDWVVGGFYLDQPDRPGSLSHYAVANYAFLGNEFFGANTSGLKSKALYGHAIYDLSGWVQGLRISGGLRYSKDSYSTHGYNGVGYCTGSVADCIARATLSTTSGHSHALTWTAGIEEQLSERTLIYVTTSKGYRPGGANPFDAVHNIQPPSFGPEYVLETELGIKSDWLLAGIPIRTNVSVWHQSYTDIQQQVLHDPQAYTQNAGSAKLLGGELEVNAELTPALELGLNYGRGYITYTRFSPGTDAAAIAQLEAQRTYNFPPHKVNAHVRYRLPLAPAAGTASVRADYNWQATSGWAGIANDLGMQKAFGILNLSAHWEGIYGKPVDLEFFMSNAANKVYTTQAVQAWQPLYYGYGNNIYGEPRMYGLRVRFNFGT